MTELQLLDELTLLDPDTAEHVERIWPLTLQALRAGEPDTFEIPALADTLGTMRRVLERELLEHRRRATDDGLLDEDERDR